MKQTNPAFWGNVFAVSFGVLVALILAELISRVFIPIFPGTKQLELDGQELNIDYVQKGAVYRQYSEEYDALTTITPKGYRMPAVADNPQMIFLGDSFTFGQGLSDEHTFPYLFCNTLQTSCANLGFPGGSTISELDRLEAFVAREGWRPQHVLLFVFAMTQFLGAGNDLYDNIRTEENLKKFALISYPTRHISTLSYVTMNNDMLSDFLYFVLDFRKTILEHSNFARVLKFYFGPQLKEFLAPAIKEETLDHALSLMKEQLNRFVKLGEQFEFTAHIFLIHPVQDLLRGSYHHTISRFRSISPITVHSTAHVFFPNPEQYYFPLDGHLNEKGSKQVAAYLLSDFSNLVQQ